jgi:hypothetical protein
MQSKRAAGVPNAPPATIWAIMWTSAISKSARGTLAAWPAPTRPAFRASRVHLAPCVGRVNRLPSRRSGGARRVTMRPVSDEDPVGKNLHFPRRAAQVPRGTRYGSAAMSTGRGGRRSGPRSAARSRAHGERPQLHLETSEVRMALFAWPRLQAALNRPSAAGGWPPTPASLGYCRP